MSSEDDLFGGSSDGETQRQHAQSTDNGDTGQQPAPEDQPSIEERDGALAADLFGDEDSDEDIKRPPVRAPEAPKDSDGKVTKEDEDMFGELSEGEEGEVGDDDDVNEANDKEEAMEEEREPVVLKVTVPDPGRPDPANPDMFLAKMPFYIGYEPYPFSKDTFLMEEGEDEEDVQLKVTNSIRWRPNPATGQKESNARMVRWDDGTYSLLIGEEFYEVSVNDMSKQHQYLLLSHTDQQLFQTHAKFDKYITFRPHSTQSLTHKKLTMAIANKHRKKVKGRIFTELIDPEKQAEEAAKAENEKMKARRRLEAKRRSALEAEYLDEAGLDYEGEDLLYRRGNAGMMGRLDSYKGDEYDDGFVVDDEEEEEEALSDSDESDESDDEARKSRLLEAKRGGSSTKTGSDNGNDAMDVDGSVEQGANGESTASRLKTKRLRIEDSDDEDE